MKITSSTFKHYACLFALICMTIWVYLPGLEGGFIFDDYPNLEKLAQIAQLGGTWQAIHNFIFSGGAGPTGRPVALLSFALQASSWPNQSVNFKIVNLAIHIICGLLLYWANRLILISYGFDRRKAYWAALLSCSLWLLHPLFVSTTLYTIQRMAQLPALFTLFGIIGYLKGRALLVNKPILSYIMMTTSILFFTLLATYSKENGALLPLLILIIEFCHPNSKNKPKWYWRGIFLWTPSLLIFILLCKYIDFSDNPWPERNFNQIQRLLTESRILCDYLFHLFLPQIEGNGLFQDGYVISYGFFQPIKTIISIIFIGILILFSFFTKNKYPLFSLAILFFFSAHLIESTFINLELYFEHRNYIPAMFLFLPISMGLVTLVDKIGHKLIVLISLIIVLIFGFMTWERSKLWSNIDKLKVYWAQQNPNSDRAQINYAEVLWKYGYYQKANQVLEYSLHNKQSVMIALQLLNQKIQLGLATPQDFLVVRNDLLTQKINGDVTWRLRWLVKAIIDNPNISKNYVNNILEILQAIYKNNHAVNPDFPALNMFLQGQLYSVLGQQQQAYNCYKTSAISYNDTNSALAVVTDFANHGDKKYALQLLLEMQLHYQKVLIHDPAMTKAASDLKKAITSDLAHNIKN